MHLKRVELQGYKTFAARTEFLFDRGITAVVGPNGSGKSNIADAVRWVLGEQSYRLLRGKSTEDMIFSGSAQRPRAGLAHVTITLDNSEGWMPVDFAEVTISRRAYRSGDNEYYVNGSRVRLRDVLELLGRGGLSRRTYTVIGQGLVDAALSLRPEERRLLFEEAAGITLHQSKRAEALAKLEATQANLLRINDIVTELAPRLQLLQTQAEKTERHAEITDQLQKLLRIWYGYRWYASQNALSDVRRVQEQHAGALAKRQNGIQEVERQVTLQREEQASRRALLSDWHRQSSQLHTQVEALERELAVWQERLVQMSGQQEELERELATLNTSLEAQRERLVAGEAALRDLDAQRQEQSALLSQVETQARAREAQRQMLQTAINKARDEAFRIAADMSDRRNRLTQLDEREGELKDDQKGRQGHIAACDTEIGELERQMRAMRQELDAWLEASAALEGQQKQALEQAAQTAAGRPAIERELEAARDDMARLGARRDLLERLREDMEGYYAGVRSAMRANLRGMIGPVASQIKAPADLERAIETALGGHLQDLLVDKWEVAETAIEQLKQSRGGRATFLPLDTVRPGDPLRVPGGAGIIGLASDLIEYDARLEPAIQMLLNRTLVAEDLHAARRVMREMRGSFQIVTRAGEIVRSSGAVTGGMARSESEGGMLAREREWRELPGRLSEAQRKVEEVQRKLEGNRKTEAGHRRSADDLARELQGRRQRQEELNRQIAETRRKQDRVAQEAGWHRNLLNQLGNELTALAGKRKALQTELEHLTENEKQTDERLRALQAQHAGLADDELRARLADLRSVVAVLDSRRDGQVQTLRSQRSALQSAGDQIAAKERRSVELSGSREALAGRISIAGDQRESLLAQLAELEAQVTPAETRMSEIEATLGRLYSAQDQLRLRLREDENRFGQASLEVQRQEERLGALRRQMEEDLGLVEITPTEGIAEQPPLPMEGLVSHLTLVESLPEGLDDEISRLRAQMRRLGPINPQAPEEYVESLQRHTFLTEQLADLEQASRSLRAVISELDDLMQRDFTHTFRAIASHFKEYFAMLFGGGTAQLVLTDAEDISATGIDIIARPPGKRHQGLALLSGGERALTAAALIFSILKVSPTPFCILDEVDAALDEANVGRFREGLESLSDVTQFILITHNRGTVESADTVYGITMGEDSTSRSISLRVDGKEVEPAHAA
jgi:chromosome segregation protein